MSSVRYLEYKNERLVACAASSAIFENKLLKLKGKQAQCEEESSYSTSEHYTL